MRDSAGQGDRDDLPGPHDELEPRAHHPGADGGDDSGAPASVEVRGAGPPHWNCWGWSEFPSRRRGSRTSRISFSGGMRQRVMIAMALALEPKLLIADEPTTALECHDPGPGPGAAERLAAEHGTAVILITHDLGVVAGMTQTHLRHGMPDTSWRPRSRETCLRGRVTRYTVGLLHSIPRLDAQPGEPLIPIEGLRRICATPRLAASSRRGALAPGQVLAGECRPWTWSIRTGTSLPRARKPRSGGLLEPAHARGSGRGTAASSGFEPAPPPRRRAHERG